MDPIKQFQNKQILPATLKDPGAELSRQILDVSISLPYALFFHNFVFQTASPKTAMMNTKQPMAQETSFVL